MLAEPELLEALRALTPAAFEHWMAERCNFDRFMAGLSIDQ